MMRVIIVTTETFPYGLAATQRIKCYAKSIVELGCECKVVCVNRCEHPDNQLGNVTAKGAIDGYEYHYIGGSTIKQKGWLNTFNQFTDTSRLVLMMLFSLTKKDKVVLYSYNPFLLSLVVIVSKIKGFKIYFELNEHPSVLRRLFVLNGDSKSDMATVRRVLNRVDGILCISSSLKMFLVKCGIAPDKIFVVNMMVDDSRFNGLEKQETEPYIGYCGAADNKKDGVDQLIKAFSIIHEKYPYLKLLIIGPKSPGNDNEELGRMLGVGDCVVFTGMISPDRMPQMLKNASILALARPSSIQAEYGFPTKIGEYLLSGNPVVVSSVGDIPFFLKDGETAYLSEPDNVNCFAEKLDYALSHSDKSKRVGECGRQIALTNFTGAHIMSQLKEAMKL